MSTYTQIKVSQNTFRQKIAATYLEDEASCIKRLIGNLSLSTNQRNTITQQTIALVELIRQDKAQKSGIENFMHQYDLSSQEGIILMCLAEALLRIPDPETADKLISDKLGQTHWEEHLGETDSFFSNAATWGLMLTGKIVAFGNPDNTKPFLQTSDILTTLQQLISRSGAPVIRTALKEGMRILARQFVMGADIQSALKQCDNNVDNQTFYSFDMLGEAAITEHDADKYFIAYQQAIEHLQENHNDSPANKLIFSNGISIKLSALHPRFEYRQRDRVIAELLPRLEILCQQAAKANIMLTIDAEESARLDLSLDIFEQLITKQDTQWNGLGLAVQAYQKRAYAVIEWLDALSKKLQCQVPVRLVKGAYWDSEIKTTQQQGLSEYPVFTRKAATDVSYLACAERLLLAEKLYPMFATHNAHTVNSIIQLAGDKTFEFQRLYGMGQRLYHHLNQLTGSNFLIRIYAPVGAYKDLLPYLVRRLLENGANTSFVNRIEDQNIPIEKLATDPLTLLQTYKQFRHPDIPLPVNLYSPHRQNSTGTYLTDMYSLHTAISKLESSVNNTTLTNNVSHQTRTAYTAYDPGTIIGYPRFLSENDIILSLDKSQTGFEQWKNTSVEYRAEILLKLADLLEKNKFALADLIIRDAGRCITDALDEIREAIDFCYYYTQQAKHLFNSQQLHGPTGESNLYQYHPKGLIACISPWNFPVAIFCGQIIAALITGNSVVAKPASQTVLTAQRVSELFYQAGIPDDALQLIPCDSTLMTKTVFAYPKLSGVVFTGSIATATTINQTLSQRSGSLTSLLAETGGINCMIADSSTLPEQLIKDVIHSAFNSAGQRCSALRVLFIQQDIIERCYPLLCGAMDELVIGAPTASNTDVASLISSTAKLAVDKHINEFKKHFNVIHQSRLPSQLNKLNFVAPIAFELDTLDQLQQEVFGPVLHVIPYRYDDLDNVIDQINNSQFGLTLGIHSRITTRSEYIASQVNVGNIYINRDMIGAVVGSQPFGGKGLSGTGPKAGGPDYLHQFVNEKVITTNTASIGGNTRLLSLD